MGSETIGGPSGAISAIGAADVAPFHTLTFRPCNRAPGARHWSFFAQFAQALAGARKIIRIPFGSARSLIRRRVWPAGQTRAPDCHRKSFPPNLPLPRPVAFATSPSADDSAGQGAGGIVIGGTDGSSRISGGGSEGIPIADSVASIVSIIG